MAAKKPRDQHTDASKRISHQIRAVETGDVGVVTDTRTGTLQLIAAPQIGYPYLRLASLDHVLDDLATVDPLESSLPGCPM
nr:hypothetical protein [Mycobacterium uberis]